MCLQVSKSSMISKKCASGALFTRLFYLNCLGEQRHRELYNVSFKRNSPSRMRTVTAENQFERLLESTTPLSKFPYSEQLKCKRASLERALKKVVNIIKHNKKGSFSSETEQTIQENGGGICPLLDMKPSSDKQGFRNKEELIINQGLDGDPNTVGLAIGRGMNVVCVPCDGLSNHKPLHREVVKTFKSFLAHSKFRRRGQEKDRTADHWNKVLIRSNKQGQVMLVPELKCREITEEIIDQARDELRAFYCSGSMMLHDIQSLHVRVRYKSSRMYHSQHHVHGDSHIYEDVLGCKFRISPEAFFQLNTPAAEVLYKEVQDVVKACQPQTLLDIGCGTGTIGIVNASLVNRVIGLDVHEQAVKDAEVNAGLNGVQNISFLVGSAGSLMKKKMMDNSFLTPDTLAIVNPSRNGLNWKAIQRIRCCENINNLIYISCKPHGNALLNFVDLVIEGNEDYPGKPFKAVQAIGVDMFPQTIHSELVLLFQR